MEPVKLPVVVPVRVPNKTPWSISSSTLTSVLTPNEYDPKPPDGLRVNLIENVLLVLAGIISPAVIPIG